ncbi:MAG: DUF4268 domain-containing protein [Vicinamibacteraceae bacterium]
MMRSGGDWKVVNAATFVDEQELQRLLFDVPGVLSATQFGGPEFIVAVREFGLPGSGATDLVAVAGDGSILVAECKLAKNDEIKRKVIGQIFEYAAYLWKMEYETFGARFQRLAGSSLEELIRSRLEGSEGSTEEWSEAEFREHVTTNLAQGNFTLAIVVDALNDELSRTISYLNERGRQSGFVLYALQLLRFSQGEVEVLVPQLHGASVDVIAERGATQWTERGKTYEQFFRDLVLHFKQESPGTTEMSGNGGHVGWVGFSAGILSSGTGFFWSMAQGRRLRTELYLDGEKDAVKKLFDHLHALRPEIAARFGSELSWERMPDKKASRIATYRPGNPHDTPDQRDALLDWGAKTMVRLVNALKPELTRAQ